MNAPAPQPAAPRAWRGAFADYAACLAVAACAVAGYLLYYGWLTAFAF